jgi:hypothetical protein
MRINPIPRSGHNPILGYATTSDLRSSPRTAITETTINVPSIVCSFSQCESRIVKMPLLCSFLHP